MEKKQIVKNIRNIIKSANLTQREFCDKADINYALFTQYLSIPSRNIPLDWILKISKVLNISTDKILSVSSGNDTKQSSTTTTQQGQNNGTR